MEKSIENLIQKIVNFQVDAVFYVGRFFFRGSGWVSFFFKKYFHYQYIFLINPYIQALKKETAGLQFNVGDLISSLMVVSIKAFLWLTLIANLFFYSLFSSIFLYGIFYFIYIEENQSAPIFFSKNNDGLMGQLSLDCEFPYFDFRDDDIIYLNTQKYWINLELSAADNDKNFALGNYLVTLTFDDFQNNTFSNSRVSSLLYKNPTSKWLREYFYAVPSAMSIIEQTQTITVTFKQTFLSTYCPKNVYFFISEPRLLIYNAEVTFHPILEGYKYLMKDYFYTTAIIVIGSMTYIEFMMFFPLLFFFYNRCKKYVVNSVEDAELDDWNKFGLIRKTIEPMKTSKLDLFREEFGKNNNIFPPQKNILEQTSKLNSFKQNMNKIQKNNQTDFNILDD